MDIGISRIVLVGFAVLVMLCQNLALGFCHQSNTVFLETCPCSQKSDLCLCQCPEGCTTFLELELDSYAKSEGLSFSGKVEVAVPVELTNLTETGPSLLKKQGLCFFDVSDPPIFLYGKSMLCRYGVARI